MQGRAFQNICRSQSSHQHTAVFISYLCRRQETAINSTVNQQTIQINSIVTLLSIGIDFEKSEKFKMFYSEKNYSLSFLVYFVEQQHEATEKPEISALMI